MILNKMVKEVVGYVLDGIFSSDNVRISDEKSDQIYSLASCISAGEKIKIECKKEFKNKLSNNTELREKIKS